jgi:hypothetical protein
MLNLWKPSRVLCGPVVHISGIHLPLICECSFISKKNILEKGLISLQFVAVPTDKIVHDFENHSHAVPGVMICGRGETYDVEECGVHLF